MRHLPRRALAVAILIGIVGCAHKPPVTHTSGQLTHSGERTESPDGTSPGDAQPSTDALTNATPSQTLAEKIAAYSREMEPQVRDHTSRRKMEAQLHQIAVVQATQPSQVAWAQPAATPPPAPANPIAAAPAAPNQVAMLAPAPRASDVPQIIPEGEDFAAAARKNDPDLDSDQLLQQLAGKIKENPKDLSAQMDYQMLQFVRGEQVPQMSSIAGLNQEDKEVLTALMDGLSNFRSNVRNDNNAMLGKKVQPLVQMADRLRGEADLNLPNACLCTRVDGYGVYDPIEPARFSAAKEHPVILYCEVENFASQINDKKLWETKLSSEAILYTETGLPVWNDQSKSIVDTSRNRRHDFFIVKKTKLPATLTIGRYVLKISVTDQQSNRVAETTVPVQMVAE